MFEVIPMKYIGMNAERDRDGNGNDRHNRRRDVPEEKQDHETDDDHFHDQVVFQVVDGLLDQLGTVVRGNHLDASRASTASSPPASPSRAR